MKSVLIILLITMHFVNADDFNSTSVETQKKILKLCEIYCDNRELEKYKNNSLWRDRKLALEIVKKSISTLKFVSDTLKNDRNFMLESVKEDMHAYEYVGNSLKKDKELAMLALRGWGAKNLKNMDMVLRDDHEVVLKAIKGDVKSFQYASKRLRGDKAFIFSLINLHPDIIKYATDEFKNNKKIMFEAVNKNPKCYQWIGKKLKEDIDICLATVKNYGYLLSYLSQKCRQNRKVVKAAIENEPSSLMFASKILRSDKEIVTMAVLSKGYTLHYATLALKKDKDLVALAMKSNHPYKKNPIKHNIHPDAWDSSILDDTLEILYGKDANFTQSDRLKLSDGIKIQTDLKLKSIAILRRGLVAWYPVSNANAVNISITLADGDYMIIGEGLDGKLYMSRYSSLREYGESGCNPYANFNRKYKFYYTHLKRKITYKNHTAHVEFMIVNDTVKEDRPDKEDFNAIMRRTRKVDFYVTKVRIEAGGKTVYTIYLNRLVHQNPYFTVDLPGVSKDQNITIYCTDTKHPKEYIWKDKIEFLNRYRTNPYN